MLLLLCPGPRVMSRRCRTYTYEIPVMMCAVLILFLFSFSICIFFRYFIVAHIIIRSSENRDMFWQRFGEIKVQNLRI